MAAVCNVSDYSKSTKLLASTTLRNILGTKTLAELLSEREAIAGGLKTMIDTATDPWGIDIERVEVMIPNAQIETRYEFLAPISVPQGERCATASKPAEGNGGRGGGHEGGEGQGDRR